MILLKVNRGSSVASATILGGNKSEFKLLNREIRFIKTEMPEFNKSSKKFFGSILYWLLVSLPIIIFGSNLDFVSNMPKPQYKRSAKVSLNLN